MKMSDCLLINPLSIYFSKAESKSPSIYAGIISIASFLKSKNIDVRIFDAVIENEPESKIRAIIENHNFKIIGMTVMTSQVASAYLFTKLIKSIKKDTLIIWGGIHPTLFPEEAFKTGLVDFVCSGDGEFTMLELIEAIRDRKDIKNVKNLWIHEAGKTFFTGNRAVHDINNLPYFNYDLIDYSKYAIKNIFRGRSDGLKVRYGAILAGVGCPYRCTFCINSNKLLHLGKYRRKTARRILDEAEYLTKKYQIDYFDIIDENFFVDKNRFIEFITEKRRRNISFKWNANIRANYICNSYVNDALLRDMELAGCYRLGIGAESGSQSILDKIKKDIKVEDIIKSAEIVSRSSVGVSYSFMMGIPGETSEDVRHTLKLVKRLKYISNKIAIIGPQIFRPYPGGELYDECVKKYGYNTPEDIEGWERSADLLTGYENIDGYKWVADKNLLKKIAFYNELENMNTSTMNVIKRVIFKLLILIAHFRLNHQIFYFSIEMYIKKQYKKIMVEYIGKT